MIEISESKVYEFEEFRLEAKNQRLFRRETSELVPLTPKAAEVLLYLVKNAGRVLSKNELIDEVWDNSFIEESNLSQTIFVLRKTLGEDTKNPRFILTVPNRGYQFIALVREIFSEDKIPKESFISGDFQSKQRTKDLPTNSKFRNLRMLWFAIPLILLLAFGIYWFYSGVKPAETVSEIKTIAVLPFTNIGGKTEEEYLGQGLSEVLISKLTNIKTIIVRPNTAVLKYSDASPDPKKIGGELNVEAILIGRVQKVDENIRVTVQVVRTSDGATLWAETFDDKFTNIFAVQDSISTKVTESLAINLTTGERQQIVKRYTDNPIAFQHYLEGRFFWNKRTPENLLKAAEQFEKAKQLDPKFALAYVGLADCYVLLGEYRVMSPRESFPKARQSIASALEIDNQMTEARVALAYILANFDWDFAAAEREFKASIAQNPNNATARQWYAEFLQSVGRFDESLVQLRRAEEIDPISLIIKIDYARYFYLTRQFDAAIEQANKILAIEPNYGWSYAFLWLCYKEKKLFKEAVEAHQKNELFFGRSPEEMEARKKVFAKDGWKGYWRIWLEQSENPAVRPYVQAIDKATAYHYIGDDEKTFEFLEQSFERREPWLLTIKYAPDFADMHNNSRFQDLLHRIGF